VWIFLLIVLIIILLSIISGYFQMKVGEKTNICPSCDGKGHIPGLVEHIVCCDSCEGTGKYRVETI
jgi:DnaJ-class molecular chaperone